MKDKAKKEKTKLSFEEEIKRLNRVVGQIEGIKKMLEAGRKLDDVITQCKAVHSAISAVEQRVFKVYLDAALDDIIRIDKKKAREEVAEEIEFLFKKSA